MPPGRYGPPGASNFQHIQQSQYSHGQQSRQLHQNPHNGVQLQTAGVGGHPGFMSGMGLPGSSINNGGFEGARLADAGGTGLASHQAQMSFARGGQLPTNGHGRMHDGQMAADGRGSQTRSRIRNVWKSNLGTELQNLRQLVEKYPYIAMDTEFPGIVARPIGQFNTKAEYHYQTLRCNVDLLKMIQLGITLFASDGSLPSDGEPNNPQSQYVPHLVQSPWSWQFNFTFSLSSDMYAQESTAMLEKAGIDFASHEKNGIDPHEFGALLYSSGLVLDVDVKWISFHSGYDFGYLMKIMLQTPLPEDEDEFHDRLNIFFPSLFDIKYLIKHAGRNQTVNNSQALSQDAASILQKLQAKSGLQDIADELGIPRVGIAHQAGSDSLLTGQVYFKMRDRIFGGDIAKEKYSGMVWGLNGQMGPSGRDFNTPNMNGAIFYNNGAPSTPQAKNAGPAHHSQTPGPQANHHSMGHATPGGGGFGQFSYAKA